MYNSKLSTVTLEEKLGQAAQAARELYVRGKAFGPDANISIREGGRVYITRRECAFHSIEAEDFACVTMSGKPLSNIPACAELPLHLIMYRQRDDIKAVIHAHSTYATLWSCLSQTIPAHTPHLQDRVGSVGWIPAAESGSKELLIAFLRGMNGSMAYLLESHGAIVGGGGIMDALHSLNQLEESAKLAWIMRHAQDRHIAHLLEWEEETV